MKETAMIAKLTGIIDSIHANQIILDVQGVGYLVSCSAHTLRLAGCAGDPLALWIETIVREDAFNLFGFTEESEQNWFRLLTTVQGVGAKAALSILGVQSPETLASAIAAQDKKAFTAADGIGPKIAMRIITELKDKVANWGTDSNNIPMASAPTDGLIEDTISALTHLGYRRMDAFAAATTARYNHEQQHEGDMMLDDLIRMSLARLSQKDGPK